MGDNGIGLYSRRIHRVVESGVGGWGAVMEVVARRKFAAKDKFEPFVGAEVSAGPQIALWRSWTFCLLVGCILTITAGLWGHWTSYAYSAYSATTAVTVNLQQFSQLPAITTEELGISTPDPVPSIFVQDVVLFPDNVMLLVRVSRSVNLEVSTDSLECQFGESVNRTTAPVISIKPRTRDLQIVRCSRPNDHGFPSKLHSNVTLGIRDSEIIVESSAIYHPRALPSWESLVYENLVDGDVLVLLAKGLVTRSSKKIEVLSLKCVFGTDLPSVIEYETAALTAAQEVIRCEKPPAYLDEKLRGHRVSIKASWLSGTGVLPSVSYYDPDKHSRSFLASFANKGVSADDDESKVSLDGDFLFEEDGQVLQVGEATTAESPLPVATIGDDENLFGDPLPKRKLCACTMVWNKGQFIREWVMFHSFMGVEKYLVYDNDSDDGTEEILESLSVEYNVSRMVWPWIKTQQAAFSHCTILARDECEWMLFTDVDEYIYPPGYLRKEDPEPSDAKVFHRMIEKESANAVKRHEKLGQIQFDCHNFGPSGLASTPKQGVTVGYTCRVKVPERHKSIIMLDALDEGLLNVLHHFELQKGYHSLKMNRKIAVCNHYKFQAWDAFKMKFVRRAGTYTTDWQKNESRGSKDRTPGLGTEAVKPDDWEARFCEVQDKGLREFSLRTFALAGNPDRMVWQIDTEESTATSESDEQLPSSDDRLTSTSDDQSTLISDDQPTSTSEDQSTSTSEEQSTSTSEDQSTSTSEDQSTPSGEDQSTPSNEDQATPSSDDKSTSTSEDQSTPRDDFKSTAANDEQSTDTNSDQSTATNDDQSTATKGDDQSTVANDDQSTHDDKQQQ